MRTLSGQDIEALTLKLGSTLSRYDLQIITQVATGDGLYDAYASDLDPKNRQIHSLLGALCEQGTLGYFLAEVWERRPNRPDVRDLIVRYFPEASDVVPTKGPRLDFQRGGVPVSGAPEFALGPGLQKNIRPHLTMVDLGNWPERLLEVRRRICRVDLDGNALGTGVLVGPRTVLTNWHVICAALAPGAAERLTCRFDYLSRGSGGRAPGVSISLSKVGVLDFSPCSPAECTAEPDSSPPSPVELDYALLELAEAIGNERGAEVLPETAPRLPDNAPLLIAQHADGGQMRLAFDTDAVIGRMHSNLRLRYRTNTQPGSSGSPVFDINWQLIALHHLGDPAGGSPGFNQGIPGELIRAQIISKGFGASLAGIN